MKSILKTYVNYHQHNNFKKQSEKNLFFVQKIQVQKNPIYQPIKIVGKLIQAKKNCKEGHKQIQENLEQKDHQEIKILENTYIKKKKMKVLFHSNKKDHFIEIGERDKDKAFKIKVFNYRDFLWKISFSFFLYVVTPIELQKNYKVFIGNGNNNMLIKSLFKKRWWWTFTQNFDKQTNFCWSQLKINQVYKYQKWNLRQFQKIPDQIKTSQTQINDNTICKTKIKIKKQETEDYNKKIMNSIQYNQWREYYNKNYKAQAKHNQETINRRKHICSNTLLLQSKLQMVHNHFQHNYFIGNKKALYYTMKNYYQLIKQNVFDYLPLTFHIESGVQDPQYFAFVKSFHEKRKQINRQNSNKKKNKNIWIVKPGQLTNRGNGIIVCDTFDSIKNIIKTKQKHSNGNLKTYIIQKYIDKPFLYYRRKFDIRHYILIVCINGCFKGYWYQDGYIRTSSYEFNLKTCDAFIHLTNDSVQKQCQDYGKYEKANKISYQQFQKYLDQLGRNYNFINSVYPTMKVILIDQKIATDCIRASFIKLDPNKRQNNFQLFGLDFMIDENFLPWLIEINTNPCLQIKCNLQHKIIPHLVQNTIKYNFLIRIGVDSLFPPPYSWPLYKRNHLQQNILQNNKFEIIFDQAIEGVYYKNLFSNYQNSLQIQKLGYIDQGQQFEDQGIQINFNDQL